MTYECFSNVAEMPMAVPVPVLLPSMKGWLSGPQQEFIEQNYLQTFCKYRLEDLGRLKNYAKTAANGLLVKFSWRHPFNVPPMPVEVEDVLSPEDAAMKGAVMAWLYPVHRFSLGGEIIIG